MTARTDDLDVTGGRQGRSEYARNRITGAVFDPVVGDKRLDEQDIVGAAGQIPVTTIEVGLRRLGRSETVAVATASVFQLSSLTSAYPRSAFDTRTSEGDQGDGFARRQDRRADSSSRSRSDTTWPPRES